jgi:hypothetical protein
MIRFILLTLFFTWLGFQMKAHAGITYQVWCLVGGVSEPVQGQVVSGFETEFWEVSFADKRVYPRQQTLTDSDCQLTKPEQSKALRKVIEITFDAAASEKEILP